MAILETLRTDPMAFLRNVLRTNAAFSILSGVLMIGGGAGLGRWLGRSGSVAPDGVVLLVFGGLILWIARRESVNLKAATAVIALDALYVVDTARQILTGQFSGAGNWFYGVVTLLVLDLAVMQTIGAIRSARARTTPVALAADRS